MPDKERPKYTPPPWEWRGVPAAGLEIEARLFVLPHDVRAECIGMKFKFFVCPDLQNVHLHLNSKGEVWAQIAYEQWVQFPTEEWKGMQEANARLIAAAPELFEACRKAFDYLQGKRSGDTLEESDLVEQLRKSIAKADSGKGGASDMWSGRRA